MKIILKFIEAVMILFGAVLFGVPVVSLIAAPMALVNLVWHCGSRFRGYGTFYYKVN